MTQSISWPILNGTATAVRAAIEAVALARDLRPTSHNNRSCNGATGNSSGADLAGYHIKRRGSGRRRLFHQVFQCGRGGRFPHL